MYISFPVTLKYIVISEFSNENEIKIDESKIGEKIELKKRGKIFVIELLFG
jgi:hypothetical protein